MTRDEGPAGPAVAPPPVPADVGLVAALPIEVAPFLARLKNVRKYAGPRRTIVEGECGGKIVAAIVAGVGREAAGRGVRMLHAGHRPRWVLSAGFAGALDPARRRNEVVLVDRVLSEVEGEPPLLIDLAVRGGPDAASPISTGSLLTAGRIVRTPADKAALRERYGCDLVDMETYAVAAYCAERGVRCVPVRVVSDEAGTELPPEILTILGPTGGFRLGAAVGAVWKRPSSLKDLWSLREKAHEAADRLGAFLPKLIEQLP
jgi:adenosylhomocysteine nucleosidase